MPLETIIEQADEQPLEQTFVQLAHYLADTLQESQIADVDTAKVSDETVPEQSKQFIELRAILQDIAEVLPLSYYVDEETSEQHIKITPELTEQLLLLLRSLGYEQPKEALVEFVRVYGLTFLLQAIQYMCQLSNTIEQQEFLASTSVAVTRDDTTDDYGSLLGKAVLRLLSIRTFGNEVVA